MVVKSTIWHGVTFYQFTCTTCGFAAQSRIFRHAAYMRLAPEHSSRNYQHFPALDYRVSYAFQIPEYFKNKGDGIKMSTEHIARQRSEESRIEGWHHVFTLPRSFSVCTVVDEPTWAYKTHRRLRLHVVLMRHTLFFL